MPRGWFIGRYIRDDNQSPVPGIPCRVPPTDSISFDGVTNKIHIVEWRNNYCIIEVLCTSAMLSQIAALPNVVRIPGALLNDPFTLSAGQITFLQARGLTPAEIATVQASATVFDALKALLALRREVVWDGTDWVDDVPALVVDPLVIQTT